METRLLIGSPQQPEQAATGDRPQGIDDEDQYRQSRSQIETKERNSDTFEILKCKYNRCRYEDYDDREIKQTHRQPRWLTKVINSRLAAGPRAAIGTADSVPIATATALRLARCRFDLYQIMINERFGAPWGSKQMYAKNL